MHHIAPEVFCAANDFADFTELWQRHLVASWAHWVRHTKDQAVDRTFGGELTHFSRASDAAQDVTDEMQPCPFGINNDNNDIEDDPFGFGPIDIDGAQLPPPVSTVDERWQVNARGGLDTTDLPTASAIIALRNMYPNRKPPESCSIVHITLGEPLKPDDKDPDGVTGAETNAVAWWLERHRFTPLVKHAFTVWPEDQYPDNYRTTYQEIALAVEAETRVGLGGPAADWGLQS